MAKSKEKKENIRWRTLNAIIDTSPKNISTLVSGGTITFTPSDKLVFLTIFRGAKPRIFNNQRGYYTNTTTRKLAEITGLHSETVTRSIQKWIKARYLIVARRGMSRKTGTVYGIRHFSGSQYFQNFMTDETKTQTVRN